MNTWSMIQSLPADVSVDTVGRLAEALLYEYGDYPTNLWYVLRTGIIPISRLPEIEARLVEIRVKYFRSLGRDAPIVEIDRTAI